MLLALATGLAAQSGFGSVCKCAAEHMAVPASIEAEKQDCCSSRLPVETVGCELDWTLQCCEPLSFNIHLAPSPRAVGGMKPVRVDQLPVNAELSDSWRDENRGSDRCAGSISDLTNRSFPYRNEAYLRFRTILL